MGAVRSPTAVSYGGLSGALVAEHIKEEESDDLPRLEAALTQEDSEDCSKTFGQGVMLWNAFSCFLT
jgi:hypothetical protein